MKPAPFASDSSITSDIPPERPPVLYHYCSAEAFKAIVENGCLWLSDAAHMNDAFEGKWLDTIIERLIIPSQDWGQWFEAGHIFHDYQVFKKPFYIACFSEQGDLLSQWRAYANDGQGISIGFNFDNSSLPTGLTFTNVFHMSMLGCTVDRVIYEEDAQLEAVQRVFKYHDYIMRGDLHPYVYDAAIDTGRDCLAYLARLLKHSGFREEREWRLIYDGESDRKGMGIDMVRKQRLRGEARINYFEFGFRAIGHTIREILLGPKCSMSSREAEQLLKGANHQDVEVKRSGVPYR
jgi:hypothetical protein